MLDDLVIAEYTHTLTVTGRLGGLYKCTVSNDKPSEDSAQLNVQGTVVASFPLLSLHSPSPSAPSPPSAVNVSQNGLDSVLVSWTPPSGEPDVTGYIIYYQQDGGQRLSVSAGTIATTATITRLITRATYSITMVATSSTLPSTETTARTVTIGNKVLILLGNGFHMHAFSPQSQPPSLSPPLPPPPSWLETLSLSPALSLCLLE